MKRIATLFTLGLFLLPLPNSMAQIREFGNFATTGKDDAEKLFTAYVSPYLNGG